MHFSARFIERRPIEDFVWEFSFEFLDPKKISFQPGQKVEIKDIIGININKQFFITHEIFKKTFFKIFINRYFLDKKTYDFLINMPFGLVTNGNAPISVMDFVFSKDCPRYILFCDSFSFPAVLSIVKYLLFDIKFDGRIEFFWIAENVNEFFYLEDLSNFMDFHDNFIFVPVLKNQPENWKFKPQNIKQVLDVIDISLEDHVYAYFKDKSLKDQIYSSLHPILLTKSFNLRIYTE